MKSNMMEKKLKGKVKMRKITGKEKQREGKAK